MAAIQKEEASQGSTAPLGRRALDSTAGQPLKKKKKVEERIKEVPKDSQSSNSEMREEEINTPVSKLVPKRKSLRIHCQRKVPVKPIKFE